MSLKFRGFTKALKSSIALLKILKKKNKKTSFPETRFKSRKHNLSSIEIRTRGTKSTEDGAVRSIPRYFGFSKNEGIMFKEKILELEFVIRLQCTRDEKFYLCIPRMKKFEQTSSSR
uniref:Uncharacterized protein n=1 Tax=Globisporangium ultimum (strain ATCC 200006 / CBS 805.95 / DAOM BR144) TaxID=431595 RepID=K3WLQ5_GLOUD